MQVGATTDDFGAMLLGFLERYGGGRFGSRRVFDYTLHAVSVASGGIVPKAQVSLLTCVYSA